MAEHGPMPQCKWPRYIFGLNSFNLLSLITISFFCFCRKPCCRSFNLPGVHFFLLLWLLALWPTCVGFASTTTTRSSGVQISVTRRRMNYWWLNVCTWVIWRRRGISTKPWLQTASLWLNSYRCRVLARMSFVAETSPHITHLTSPSKCTFRTVPVNPTQFTSLHPGSVEFLECVVKACRNKWTISGRCFQQRVKCCYFVPTLPLWGRQAGREDHRSSLR